MSVNQYMHPRNVYKQPPNFKDLAILNPEFRKYTTQDITGKITFNFKSVEALRCLTCTLLRKDFGIDLDIPLNKLIPTVPLRLNYILWIEDLLSLCQSNGTISGIDIGTGASCIYPLLGAKKNGWHMLATEIDSESIQYAQNNVNRNSLGELIEIVAVKKDTLLEEALSSRTADFDFCMCNPPFFSSTHELNPSFKARNLNRPHPKNAFCASVDEVVSKGGEVEYVSKLIHESKNLNCRVKIYTSMIGHKTSLQPLKNLLREVGVASFKQTEFCQGHTTRWGLAWTFHDLDLRKIPDLVKKEKHAKPLCWQIPNVKVNDVNQRLISIFKELQMEYQEVKHVKYYVQYLVTAYGNTWSNQRRKRRQMQRQLNGSGSSSEEMNVVNEACEQLAQIDVNCRKRKVDEDDDHGNDENQYYDAKKFKNETESKQCCLKGLISVIGLEAAVGLELVFIEGSAAKEGMHQVLQFIKNKFQKDVL